MLKSKTIFRFKWFKQLYVIYIFGFVFSFQPALPFFYEFLITDKLFSKNEVFQHILPIYYYSVALCLLVFFPLMETFKYNPFIIVSTLTGITATCLHIWTKSLLEIQIAQVFYGCSTATELAYFISIYAHGDAKSFQKLTSYVRTAPHVGKILASFLAQLFISMHWLTYTSLHYLNLTGYLLAAILTIFLPQVDINGARKLEKQETSKFNISSLLTIIKNIFPNKNVVKWAIWSTLTISGHVQFLIYVQPLWKYLQEINNNFKYNGVLAGTFFTMAVIANILAGHSNFDWKFKGDLILSMTSLVEAFMLLLMSQIVDEVLNSLFYIFLAFILYFVMTMLYAEIAKFSKPGYFGYIFGLIELGGWLLSSGVVQFYKSKLGIQHNDFQSLFMFYGFYHLAVSILFICVGLSYWFAKHTYEI